MIKRLKRKMKYLFTHKGITDSFVYQKLVIINRNIFHRDKREKMLHMGQYNEDKTFYIIRSFGEENGLLSNFIYALKKIDFAVKNDYIPYVLLDSKKDDWNNFFIQPSEYSLEEIYLSKNVILSDIETGIDNELFNNWKINKTLNFNRNNMIKKYTWFSKEVLMNTDKQRKAIGGNHVLGVYVRGTDYVSLKPTGHPRQPTLEVVINKINEFLNRFSEIDSIYLVTEDINIKNRLFKEYGDIINESAGDYFDNYDGKQYLSEYYKGEEAKYYQSLNYLSRIILLSECEYFIGSITNGTIISSALNNNKYKESYIFDLGLY